MTQNHRLDRAGVSGPGEPVGGGAAKAPAVRAFRARLPILFLVRTTINTSFRIIYPFLPGIARGLGISLAAASRLITLRMVAGMGAPLLGPLADRYGRRRVMEMALLLFVLASLLLAGVGTLAAAVVAFTLYGVAKALYDPAVHAYVGDQVPYRERGRAVGVVELSWSSAWLLGVPASGFLIERFGWRRPSSASPKPLPNSARPSSPTGWARSAACSSASSAWPPAWPLCRGCPRWDWRPRWAASCLCC
jgi:MFS family permease